MTAIMAKIRNMSRKALSKKRRTPAEAAGGKAGTLSLSADRDGGRISILAPSLDEGPDADETRGLKFRPNKRESDNGSGVYIEGLTSGTSGSVSPGHVRHAGAASIFNDNAGQDGGRRLGQAVRIIAVLVMMTIGLAAQYYEFPVPGDFGIFGILSALSIFIMRRQPLLAFLILIAAAAASGIILRLRDQSILFVLEPFAMVVAAWLISEHALKTQAQADRSMRKLRMDIDELQRISMRDPLTGLYNRRYAFEVGPALVAEKKRLGTEAHLIMLDIDHFKQVNDRLGHPEGDIVLKECSAIFSLMLRSDLDVLARIGGEEFIIIMPDSNSETAYNVANRIRDIVRSHSFSGVPWQITVSLGVVAFKENESFDSALERVDLCLYHSKRSGRNRVTVG